MGAEATIAVVHGHLLHVGGVETHLLTLFEGMHGRRWRWVVLSATSERFAGRAQALGVIVRDWAPRHALDGSAARVLRATLREEGADLLHLHDARARWLAFWATRGRLPSVATVHLPTREPVGGGGLSVRARHRAYAAVESWLFARGFPDRVIHVSRRAARASAHREGTLERTTVIPNGIDVDRYMPSGQRERVRRSLGVADDAVVVLAVARLDRQKGLDILIEAATRLPSQVHIWIAGDGPLRADLERQASHGTRPVTFLGWRDDVPALLEAADMFVLPSRHETTPFALMEALAAGLPCVATDVGDVAAMLGSPPAGLVVPPADVDGLVSALGELAADPRRRRPFADRARVRGAAFAAEGMVRQTERALSDLLDAPEPPHRER